MDEGDVLRGFSNDIEGVINTKIPEFLSKDEKFRVANEIKDKNVARLIKIFIEELDGIQNEMAIVMDKLKIKEEDYNEH